MADRDQTLAEFQAFTGNENIEECIVILEQHDWNLMDAVQTTLAGSDPDPNQSAEPMMGTTGFQPMINPFSQLVGGPTFSIDDGIVGQSIRSLNSQQIGGVDIPPGEPIGAAASSSASAFQPLFASRSAESQPIRLLQFIIEYRDRNIQLNVLDSENVGKLKELLETEIGVPVSKQELCGWVKKSDKKISDEDKLCDLRLPKENTLFLLTPEISVPAAQRSTNGDDTNLFERLSQTFTLKILFKDKDQTYSLNFPGSKTIQEVKGDVYSLIDVPVSKQVWSGWPGAVDDDTMTLAGSGVSFPCHALQVSSAKVPRQRQTPRKSEDMELDSEEDLEDAHENFSLEDNFLDTDIVGPRKPEPLMPENAANERDALESFSNEFALRFGECHPVFYIGDLEDALKEALQCRARDRKLLAIYLHHDGSILANVFCSQILCAESVVSFLSSNFITWAWDLTSDANRARLLTMCNRHFGNVAATTVRNIQADELPLLLIISRSRGTNEVVNAIRGNTHLDELMGHLLHAHDDFRQQLQSEIQEEDEREARERMKSEQDHDYQESLAADRAKEEQKRAEDEERRKRQQEEIARQEKEEHAKLLEEQTKEAVRQSVANELPDEPPPNCKEALTTIRFRCPDGRNLVRRFLAHNSLQVLLNYVTSEGYHITDYKVLTTFPRRDLSASDTDASLESLKLCPQETVILEEK